MHNAITSTYIAAIVHIHVEGLYRYFHQSCQLMEVFLWTFPSSESYFTKGALRECPTPSPNHSPVITHNS